MCIRVVCSADCLTTPDCNPTRWPQIILRPQGGAAAVHLINLLRLVRLLRLARVMSVSVSAGGGPVG